MFIASGRCPSFEFRAATIFEHLCISALSNNLVKFIHLFTRLTPDCSHRGSRHVSGASRTYRVAKRYRACQAAESTGSWIAAPTCSTRSRNRLHQLELSKRTFNILTWRSCYQCLFDLQSLAGGNGSIPNIVSTLETAAGDCVWSPINMARRDS